MQVELNNASSLHIEISPNINHASSLGVVKDGSNVVGVENSSDMNVISRESFDEDWDNHVRSLIAHEQH